MLYEFYYSILRDSFGAIYFLDVERETEKMVYGTARKVNNRYITRFAARKDSINVVEATHEYVYRIRVSAESYDEALKKVQTLLCNFLLQKAEAAVCAGKEVVK